MFFFNVLLSLDGYKIEKIFLIVVNFICYFLNGLIVVSFLKVKRLKIGEFCCMFRWSEIGRLEI